MRFRVGDLGVADVQPLGDGVSERDNLREDCWTQALYAFGTAAIFEQRSRILGRKLRVLDFLGIGVPLAVGGVVTSFSLASQHLELAVLIAGIVSVPQLILTAWSLVSRWEDSYAYALESMADNYRFAQKYESLGRNPPNNLREFQFRRELLNAESSYRDSLDYKQGLSDKEKRRGMQVALRQYQRPCAGCGEVPKSLKPTDCSVCGQF
jgi:mobilome CxxCx(11)CxxC protein